MKGTAVARLAFAALALACIPCCRPSSPPATAPRVPFPPTITPSFDIAAPTTLHLRSPAFKFGEPIPALHTCNGAGISPALSWSSGPKGTQAYVMMCHDPDAPGGNFTHWLLYNIPANTRALKQGETKVGVDGLNSFGAAGYGGPCPPSGTHRYIFRVFALSASLSGPGNDRATAGMAPPPTSESILRYVREHVLAQGNLVGSFAR